jgi:NAD(P)-dependent dehydrogenase (short-subunit alcohol dehydrogenase family)
MRVAVAARNTGKLATLSAETGAQTFTCDAVDPDQVARLFDEVEGRIGAPDVVVYNASGRLRGPLVQLVPAEVEQTLAVSAFGGFLVAQQAVRRMLPKGFGAIRNPGRTEAPDKPDSMLDPDAIAETYLHVLRQPRSAWTWEIELRPWVEKF